MAPSAKTGRQLLFSVTIKDCRVDTFTVPGHGGSGKDTSNTGVRVTHEPSGAVGVGQEERSQHRNKIRAFRRMVDTPKFRAWMAFRRAELLGEIKRIEERVEEQMRPEFIRTEGIDPETGCWVRLEQLTT